MDFEFFWGQIIWSALKVWFSDFIQNLSQAPSKYLSEHKSGDKFDYLKNPSRDFKFFFVLGSYESLAMLDGKTRKDPFFYNSIL